MTFAHQIENASARFEIEIACRLVGEKNFRIDQKRASDRHALLLATGKLIREVSASIVQSELVQQLGGLL